MREGVGGEARQVGTLAPGSRGFWSLRGHVGMTPFSLYCTFGQNQKRHSLGGEESEEKHFL